MSKKTSKSSRSANAEARLRKNHSKGRRVFITGISGFIGSALAEHLLSLGYEVSGLVRQSRRPAPTLTPLLGRIELFEGNLTDYSGIANVLRSARPDVIIHLGAITPVSYSFDHPQEVTQVNYLGTVNLAEAARRELPNLELFSFSSSMEVYGQQVERPFHEYFPVFPNCPYAVAKEASERYMRYLWQTYRFPAVTLRQTNCYGRKHDDYFVVEAFITSMLKNRKVVNFGRREPVRNFIHIDDLVRLHESIIRTHEVMDYGEIFNTGPNNGITIETLATIVAEETGFKGKINWNTRELRAGEIFYLNSVNAKATKHFGWEPMICLREGIRRGVAHWKSKLAPVCKK